MQCPTCGSHTPGTLDRCSTCGTTLNAPLGAPVAEPSVDFGEQTMVVPPQGQAVQAAPAPKPIIGEQTLMVPPPTPSWAAEPAAAPARQEEPAQGDGKSESTAPWAFDPSEPSGPFEAVPQPPAPQRPASPPPPPTWGPPQDIEPPVPAESIVPESWYAKPRRPQQETEVVPERWTPAEPPQPQPLAQPSPGGWGPSQADATRISPPPNTNPQQGFPQQPGFGGPQQGAFGQQNGAFGGPPNGQFGTPGDQFGGQFGGPNGQGHPPPASSGGRAGKPLILGVGALVLVASVAVGVTLWPDGGEDAAAKPPAKTAPPNKNASNNQQLPQPVREQAQQMNAVLDASPAARRALLAGLGAARTCKGLPQAIGNFQQVAQQRQKQLTDTRALQVNRLPNGEKMRATLQQSFQASLDVDKALLTWAQRSRAKCKKVPKPSAAHAPGRSTAERRATLSKKQFVRMWNPVAKKTGQKSRPWTAV